MALCRSVRVLTFARFDGLPIFFFCGVVCARLRHHVIRDDLLFTGGVPFYVVWVAHEMARFEDGPFGGG